MLESRPAWILTSSCLLLLAVHLFVPGVQLDAIALALILLAALPLLLPHLKNLKLPGGMEIELKDVQQATEQVDQLVEREATVDVSGYVATEDEARARAETRESIATLREVADSDPALALVGFRIELEKRLRELAERHDIRSERRPLSRIARELASRDVLSLRVVSGLEELVQLGNRAAHGAAVDRDASVWVLDEGVSVLNALDGAIHGDDKAG